MNGISKLLFFVASCTLSAACIAQVATVPGVGTVISVRGVPQGEPFREPEFYAVP